MHQPETVPSIAGSRRGSVKYPIPSPEEAGHPIIVGLSDPRTNRREWTGIKIPGNWIAKLRGHAEISAASKPTQKPDSTAI
jgi:hypothetical protein